MLEIAYNSKKEKVPVIKTFSILVIRGKNNTGAKAVSLLRVEQHPGLWRFWGATQWVSKWGSAFSVLPASVFGATGQPWQEYGRTSPGYAQGPVGDSLPPKHWPSLLCPACGRQEGGGGCSGTVP